MPLNIQLFAGAGDQTKQAIIDSYDSSIKEGVLQYNMSRTDDICQLRTAASASNRFYNLTDTVATASGRNAQSPNTGGEQAKLRSKGGKVWAVDVATGAYSIKNYYFEDDFWQTPVDVKSPMVKKQSSAVILRDDLVFMDALEKAYTGVEQQINGDTNNIKIPDKNKFGKSTDAFSFETFKQMLVTATTIASTTNAHMKIFMDTDAQSHIITQNEILSSDYFSKNLLERNTLDKLNWNAQTKIEVFPQLNAELYGKADPWTKGRIYVVIKDCVGKKRVNASIRGKVVELDETDEVMFKTKFMTGAGVVDPDGIFVYEYNPEAAAAASVLSEEPSASTFGLTPKATPAQQPDIDKVIELEKIRAERAKEERMAAEAKLKLHEVENKAVTIQAPTDQETTRKSKAKVTEDPAKGTTE